MPFKHIHIKKLHVAGWPPILLILPYNTPPQIVYSRKIVGLPGLKIQKKFETAQIQSLHWGSARLS